MTIEVSRLKNGLTIATDRMSHVETASVGVWIKAGSRSEAANEHGVAHLMEHMAFKGTRHRSARDIAVAIEAVGGDLNAATGLETTTYHARTLAADSGLAIGLLAEILQESAFDPEELKREQNVIVQEIGAAADAPEDIIYDMIQEAAFPDQPIGRPILGTAASVTGFTRDDVLGYLNREYRASAMVLAAAGAVDHAAIVAQAEAEFSGLSDAPPEKPQPARYVGGEQRLRRKHEQVNLIIGLEGVPWGDPRSETAQILSSVLGGGMSSRLFQEVRETRGLCYHIQAYHAGFEDSGMLAISAATGKEHLDDLIRVTAEEIVRLQEDVEEIEVDRVKAQIKASLLMGLESSMARAERIARQLLAYGRVIPMEEMIGRVEAVDAAAVRILAGDLLRRGPPTLAAIGPIARLEALDKIAERLGSPSPPSQRTQRKKEKVALWPF